MSPLNGVKDRRTPIRLNPRIRIFNSTIPNHRTAVATRLHRSAEPQRRSLDPPPIPRLSCLLLCPGRKQDRPSRIASIGHQRALYRKPAIVIGTLMRKLYRVLPASPIPIAYDCHDFKDCQEYSTPIFEISSTRSRSTTPSSGESVG